jgi:hypothetical protein
MGRWSPCCKGCHYPAPPATTRHGTRAILAPVPKVPVLYVALLGTCAVCAVCAGLSVPTVTIMLLLESRYCYKGHCSVPMGTIMTPISDLPNYNANKQRRYRERQKLKDHVAGVLSQDSGERDLGIHLERACFATVRGALFPNEWKSIENYASDRWEEDSITPLVLRAAQNPSKTTDANMSALLTQVTGDFISSLAPISAAAKVFAAAVQANLDGIHAISLPRRAGPIDPAKAQWIDEGNPILVPIIPLEGVLLGPMKKLGSMVVYTKELAEHGNNAEEVFRTLLRETVAAQLDAHVFSNLAATTARPPGLLNGITPLTGSAVMDDDLTELVNAIGAVTSGLAIVGHPNQINAIRLKRGTTWPADVPLIPTIGVAAGTVVALDPLALAVAFGEPRIDASNAAMVQLQDTPTSDPMTQGPVSSMFQTASIALKLLFDVAYALRLSGSVAWLNNATW